MFNKENCLLVIESFEKNDDINGIKMFTDVLNSYHQKYEIRDVDAFEKDFRDDTKLMFQVFKGTFASEQMIEDFSKELNTNNEQDQKELKEFLEVVANITFILAKIDTVDLLHPDEKFTYNCKNAISYFYKKMEEANGLNNTMKNLSHTLNSLIDILPNMMDDIKIDTNEPVEETKYYDSIE